MFDRVRTAAQAGEATTQGMDGREATVQTSRATEVGHDRRLPASQARRRVVEPGPRLTGDPATLSRGELPIAPHIDPWLNDAPSAIPFIRGNMLAFMSAYAREFHVGRGGLPSPHPDHLATIICEEITRRSGFDSVRPLSQLLKWRLVDFANEDNYITPTMKAIVERVLRETPADMPSYGGQSLTESEAEQFHKKIAELEDEEPLELNDDQEAAAQLTRALKLANQSRPRTERLLPGALDEWDLVEKVVREVVARRNGLPPTASFTFLRERGLLRQEDFYVGNSLSQEITNRVRELDHLSFMKYSKKKLMKHIYGTPSVVEFPPAYRFPEADVLEQIICEEVSRQANLGAGPTTILQLRRQGNLTFASFSTRNATVIAILERLALAA